VKKNDRQWVFYLDPAGEFSPVGGDLVAINNNKITTDLQGLDPKQRTFKSIDGGSPGQTISDFFVTFANGKNSSAVAGEDVSREGTGFVPIDSMGYPVPGNSNGKCGNCQVGHEGSFAGSVIFVETRQPVTYVFTIYTNLGELVNRATGKIDEADLPLLKRKKTGEYLQRVVWTGVTKDGQMAGTGAYVLKADFHFEKSFKTGAKASSTTKLTRFGFLRNCCGSVLPHWYDGG
jgi:hypothetical protein